MRWCCGSHVLALHDCALALVRWPGCLCSLTGMLRLRFACVSARLQGAHQLHSLAPMVHCICNSTLLECCITKCSRALSQGARSFRGQGGSMMPRTCRARTSCMHQSPWRSPSATTRHAAACLLLIGTARTLTCPRASAGRPCWAGPSHASTCVTECARALSQGA